MSAGGINVQQPLAGVPPTGVGASPQAAGAQPQLAPVAGQQAGSVAPSGGLIDDGLPRTAAIGAHVAANAYGNAAAAANLPATNAQMPDPAAIQAGTSAVRTGASGPAAWDESWAQKFREAGADSQIIQQLNFTGGMGADAAQLEQMLEQVKADVDRTLAKFAHDHPEEFKKLRAVGDDLHKYVDGSGSSNRAVLVQIAMLMEAGQLPKEQLTQLADSAGRSMGQMIFNDFIKPMVVWSLIPGWGALRIGFAPFTGGRDILTGEKMFGDPMSTAFTIAAGIGGSITLFNHARGAMQVAQGHRLAAAGGDAARIAANEGVQALTGWDKVKSFLPGTNANKVYAGLGRFDQNLTQGISHLKGLERELAENVLDQWRRGQISIIGDPASKLTGFGFQPNARGIVIGRNKPMVALAKNTAIPTITLDGRMTGKTLAAHLASIGVEFADDASGLRSKLLTQFGSGPEALKLARESVLGTATRQLLDAKFIAQPNGLQQAFGTLRPGPLQDALWAAKNVDAGTLGKLHGTAAIPRGIKFGAFGLLAAGAGYYMMVKAPADAAKKQEEEAAKAQQQAAAQGGAAAGQSPELQAALQQFAAMPKEQQAQIIQQQYATLQQAAQQPNLTAEQQQAIVAGANELELFMQVANGGGAAAMGGGMPAAGATGAGAAQPAAPAMAGAATTTGAGATPGAGTPTFTAQGLGLAP